MLAEKELKDVIDIMTERMPASTVRKIAFDAIDSTCTGYEASNTDVYESMIRKIIKLEKGDNE